MNKKQFEDMLAIMAGDEKTLRKYAPKEEKVKNKKGLFVVKSNFGGYHAGENHLTAKVNAIIYENYDDAKAVADVIGGKVVRIGGNKNEQEKIWWKRFY